jgi:hypothetical protein
MQQTLTLATKQSCYLLNPLRITEQKAERKDRLVTDFKFALNDFYRDTPWETNCWEEMGSVIEHRKYLAELSDSELALSELYL